MTHQSSPEHFKGQSVFQHLKEARMRGALATAEVHGLEPSGHFSAGADCAKETALLFSILWAIGEALSLSFFTLLYIFIALGFGWVIWKTGRSALLGWARLERVHRLIEEERWEIQHHREQEKVELHEMYQAKGFSGKLLNEVVEVLMADDNRLLRVMLEEELGLSLEIYEHPLKQAFGAFIGTAFTALCALLSFYFWPLFGLPLICAPIIFLASLLAAHFERRKKIESAIWNLALSAFATIGAYFLTQLIL